LAGEGPGESPELGRESPEVLGRERLVGEGPGRESPELGRESGACVSPVSKCMGAARPCGIRPPGSAQPSTGAERFEPSRAPPGEEPGRVARLPIVPSIEALLGEPPSVDLPAESTHTSIYGRRCCGQEQGQGVVGRRRGTCRAWIGAGMVDREGGRGVELSGVGQGPGVGVGVGVGVGMGVGVGVGVGVASLTWRRDSHWWRGWGTWAGIAPPCHCTSSREAPS